MLSWRFRISGLWALTGPLTFQEQSRLKGTRKFSVWQGDLCITGPGCAKRDSWSVCAIGEGWEMMGHPGDICQVSSTLWLSPSLPVNRRWFYPIQELWELNTRSPPWKSFYQWVLKAFVFQAWKQMFQGRTHTTQSHVMGCIWEVAPHHLGRTEARWRGPS